MKKYLVLPLWLSFMISSFAFAQPAHVHDQPSTHGMLMMGQSKIYLSHLPMFHSPHDYQVILEVELDSSSKAKYLASQSNGTETVYTLVPETFVLPEMISNPRPFRADIFEGHFERGGRKLAGNVRVEITKVLYFKKFDPSAKKPNGGSFVLFGNDEEQFLAHAIVSVPDFDQVMRLERSLDLVRALTAKDAVVLDIPALPHAQALEAFVDYSVENSTTTLSLRLDSILYFELGDLAF